MTKRPQLNPGWVYVTLIAGVEGHALYVNGYRVTGPKPWGGGSIVWERPVRISELQRAMIGALQEGSDD